MRTLIVALSAATLITSGYALAQDHDHDAHAAAAKTAPAAPAPPVVGPQHEHCMAMMGGQMQGKAQHDKPEDKTGPASPAKPMSSAEMADMRRRCAQMMDAAKPAQPAPK